MRKKTFIAICCIVMLFIFTSINSNAAISKSGDGMNIASSQTGAVGFFGIDPGLAIEGHIGGSGQCLNDGEYGPTFAWADGAAAGITDGQYFGIEFSTPKYFNKVVYYAGGDWVRIQDAKIQISDDNVDWIDVPEQSNGANSTVVSTVGLETKGAVESYITTVKFPTVEAKYVRVYVTETNSNPRMYEIEVYNSATFENLAMAKGATAFHYDGDKTDDGKNPAVLNDGDINSIDYLSGDPPTYSPYYGIDFGEPREINNIVYYVNSNSAGDASRVTKAKLQYSGDNVDWKDIPNSDNVNTTVRTNTSDYEEKKSVMPACYVTSVAFSPIEARYIRVLIEESAHSQINEIEAYNNTRVAEGIKQIKQNENNITVSLSVVEEAELYLAGYDKNGVLAFLESEVVNPDTYSVDFDVNADVSEVKAMLLDGINTLKPISNSLEYTCKEDFSVDTITERQIIQRNAENKAEIPISGGILGDCSEISAKVISEDGETDWQLLEINEDNTYSGSIEEDAGGWYTVKIKAKMDDDQEIEKEISKVGIGDIFIISGQSNSANYGSAKTVAQDDRICTWSPDTNTWVESEDPQVSYKTPSPGTGGSPWPSFGDELVAETGVPVGFVITGLGGQSVSAFVPDGRYYNRIGDAVKHFGVNGFRAVLWHQGETDANKGMSAEDYKSSLQSIIDKTRADGGWDIPWIVATASYLPYNEEDKMTEIRQAQSEIVNNENIFAGPDTDNMQDGLRSPDEIHFNLDGLKEHGHRWADIICELMGSGAI